MLRLKFLALSLLSLAMSSCATNSEQEAKEIQSIHISNRDRLYESTMELPSTLILGRYIDGKFSSYQPKSDCVSSGEKICMQWSGYYVYTLSPVGQVSNKQTITVAMYSHSPRISASENPYLLELRRLPSRDSAAVGADYLVIQVAEINTDYCMESSTQSLSWHYTQGVRPVESVNEDGEYCYSMPR